MPDEPGLTRGPHVSLRSAEPKSFGHGWISGYLSAMLGLVGSRLHLVDAVVTRALTYVPIYVLGFSEPAIVAYVVIVVVQATFIHANVRWEFAAIPRLVVTPCYHHWHHAAEREAVNRNYSVHTPLWDWLFGTLHMPGRWPSAYGLCGPRDVPGSWAGQFAYPFRRRNSLPGGSDA